MADFDACSDGIDMIGCARAETKRIESCSCAVLLPHLYSGVVSLLITTRPYPPPPRLACPRCRGPLHYRDSAINGIADKGPERWDRFSCRVCGEFEYRHRTKRLAPVVPLAGEK